ncbi:O-antigen polysaccharide polymerase Wzy [Halomonas sp. YLGW01]|uniref:O-antigen polysaccharide polymerase Wzy n=1 Tax=Halomonas sp. YLGW01 TaxID=2773308 RepID=UPI00177EEBE9|nr:O-antigen polysaccharide polymerase Wzy [Halomonas sp. YLGW01]
MVNSNRSYSLFILLCCSFLALVVFFFAFLFLGGDGGGGSFFVLYCLVLLLSLSGFSLNKKIISPVGFFILSVVVFILARPILSIFFNGELVEAGIVLNHGDEVKPVIFLSFCLSVIVFGYCIFPAKKIDRFLPKVPSGRILRKEFSSLFLFFAFFLVFVFLYKSYQASLLLGDYSYFELAGKEGFSNHIKYFFYAKYCIIAYLLLSGHSAKYNLGALILALGGVGFLFVGLRGYAVAYFFMYLYFLAEKRSINIAGLSLIALFVVYISSAVIEYRLGIKIYDGVFDVLYKTFHQQGATFEVLYGAVNFTDELRSCIKIYDYFFSSTDFGQCVDRSRGVYWEYGGFASSFFAEIYYLGLLPSLAFCLTLGSLLKYLDFISQVRAKYLKGEFSVQDGKLHGLILFLTIPNLIYFARSGSYDLLVKFFAVLILTLAASYAFRCLLVVHPAHSSS